jgi:hypothetical protein
MRRSWLFLLILLAGMGGVKGGSPAAEDYARLFGRRYEDARDFLNRRPEIGERIRAFGLDPNFALAIVFPELLRWSALTDLVQTGYLQTFYVLRGRSSADVSIGRFQMKPAFAETLEADFNRRLGGVEQVRIAGGRFDLADTAENRLARVRRLAGLDGQVLYLVIFVRVMERLYPELLKAGLEERLRVYATAFNSGYRQGLSRLRRLSTARRFRPVAAASSPSYNYADIALDYYRRSGGLATDSGRLP